MINNTAQAIKVENNVTVGENTSKSFKSLICEWFKSYFDRKVSRAEKMEHMNTKPFDGIL